MARTFVTASAEYLRFPSCPISDWPFTIGCWFYVPTDDGANEWMLYLGDPDTSGHRCVLGDSLGLAGNPLRYIGRSGSANFSSSNSSTIGGWNSGLLAMHSTTSRDMWLNGVGTNNTATEISVPSNWTRFSIGALDRDHTSKVYFDGAIAWACVWDVGLSAGEAKAFSAGYHPYLIRPESLVLFAPLGGHDCADDQDIDHITGTALSVGGTPTTTDHPSGLIYPSQQFIPFPSAAGLPIPVASHHYTKNIGAA